MIIRSLSQPHRPLVCVSQPYNLKGKYAVFLIELKYFLKACPPVTTQPTEKQNDKTKPPSTTSNKIVTSKYCSLNNFIRKLKCSCLLHYPYAFCFFAASSKTSKTTQLGKLTFVCSGEGLSLPSIKWQLSLNHTECSLITFGLNETINCTVTLNKTDDSSATVECVCSKKNVKEGNSSSFNCVFVFYII